MNPVETIVEMNLGYTVRPVRTVVNVDTASEILLTKKQRRYTFGTRRGLKTELVGHVLVCPYCGHTIPAYQPFLARNLGLKPRSRQRVSDLKICEWTTRQMFFFDTDNVTIRFNDPIRFSDECTCSKCGREITASNRVRRAVFTRSRHKLEVECEITDISEVMSLNWVGSGGICLPFPLYEKVTFNIRNGHTHLTLGAGNEKPIAAYDVTDEPEMWGNSVIFDSFDKYTVFRRRLKREFSRLIGNELPFGANSVLLQKYVEMTRFPGYPGRFYETIPYDLGSWNIEKSFGSVAKRLQNPKTVPAFYSETGLPEMKSVRRTYFADPGLFFYLKEGVALWNLIRDPNIFCRLLEMEAVYRVLSVVHSFPTIIDFYRDYMSELGSSGLLELISGTSDGHAVYAACYCVMSDSLKADERVNWHSKDFLYSVFEGQYPNPFHCNHSVPVFNKGEYTFVRRVGEYAFVTLRTSNDYFIAGKALKNCLAESWENEDSTVVVVKKGQKYAAAVNIYSGAVTMALSENNQSVDGECDAAIKKWAASCGFNYRSRRERAEGRRTGEPFPFRDAVAAPR